MVATTEQPAILGVDLGTSSVKCVVARSGRVIASAQETLDVSNPQPGWSEQDPDAWVHATSRAIAAAISRSGLSSDTIAAIGLSGQMHGAVVLDASHRPLRAGILWNDNRATEECLRLAASVPEIGKIAGIGPLPGFTAPKLMWIAQHEPALFERISKVLLPKDYLVLWLTGELGTDRSDAAGTLLLDQSMRNWSPSVIEATGIAPDVLPVLRNGHERAGVLRGEVAAAIGLAAGIPVFAGAGDAAAGALALGAAASGKCFMSLGTSGQLLMVDDSYRPDPDRFIHDYCHTLPGLWYRMAAMLNGARPLAWFAGVLGVDVPSLLRIAEDANEAHIPLFLPYLTGERSPHGDPNIRGGFYGLDDATGRAEMALAVIEAVAFSLGDAKASFGEAFSPSGPVPAIGGGSNSDAVLQGVATITGHPVGRASVGDGGAALGAAMLAELGMGFRDSDSLVFDPPMSRIWEPNQDAGLLNRFARYQSLYTALRGTLPVMWASR